MGELTQITVLSQFGDNPALQAVLEELNGQFQSDNPDVTVDVQYLTLDDLTRTVPTTLASGEGPDVIDYDANESTLGELARAGLLLPLDDYASEYGWAERLAPSVLARTTYSDSLYGIGRSSEAVGLLYNTDLFEGFGLPAPSSYDAFIEAADALAAEEVTPIAFGNTDQWPSSHLIGAAIHALVPVDTIAEFETLAGSGSWADPTVTAAIEETVAWVERGYLTANFNGVSFDDALNQFFAGEAGMFIEGTGVIPDVIENMAGTTVEFVPFPMIAELPQQAEGGIGGAWAINAGSDVAGAAARWIDYIHFSPEAEQRWFEAGVLPTTSYDGDGADVPELVADSLSVVAAAQDGGGIGYWTGYSTSPLVTDAWNSQAQLVLDGQSTASELTTTLQEALEQARADGP